jgi:hypothetical protein
MDEGVSSLTISGRIFSKKYVMYRNALVKIKNINLKCVEYFLENILPDMVKEETPFRDLFNING